MIIKHKNVLFLLTAFSFMLSSYAVAFIDTYSKNSVEPLTSFTSSTVTESLEVGEAFDSVMFNSVSGEPISVQHIHDQALKEHQSSSQEQDRYHSLKKRPDLLPNALREMAPFITLAYRYGNKGDSYDVVVQTELDIQAYMEKGWKLAPFYADKGIKHLESARKVCDKVADLSGQQLLAAVKDKALAERDVAGFVAVKKSPERANGYDIAIACRGTQSVADGITDALFLKRELTAFGFSGKGHKGFADAAKTAIPSIYDAMKSLLGEFEVIPSETMEEPLDLFKLASDRQITFNIYPMGHSLGGAIAKNVGVFIAQDSMLGTEKSDDSEFTSLVECEFKPVHAELVNVVVVNVGGPRTSDSENAEEVERILGGAHHIVNFFDHCDPVPFQPFQLFGFSHAGVIIPLNTMTKYSYPLNLDDELLPKLATDMTGMSRQIMAHGQQLFSTGAVAYANPNTVTLMAFGSCVVDLLKETILACHSSKRYVDMIINTSVYDSWFYQGTPEESIGNGWTQAWFGDHAVTERKAGELQTETAVERRTDDSDASISAEGQRAGSAVIMADLNTLSATDRNEVTLSQNPLNTVKDSVLGKWSAFKKSVKSFFGWGLKKIGYFIG
ncbi:hypothetical protein CI610_02417 [invertebrate metagenome]|uniref:Fungal lipase-type domain-containing protein n=1 Tax=invertebrate metagenome TaxID=1711999 RepID=A0A2H9T601_9ZZZZ